TRDANTCAGVLQIPIRLAMAAALAGYGKAPRFPPDPMSTFVTRYNPLPVPTQMLQIPVLVTVPNAASRHPAPPVGGWPVLIFQHASYRNREDMFAVADSFADNGFVVAGIDLPLHGITDPADPYYATAANPLYAGLGLPANGSIERTSDLPRTGPPTIDPD